MGGRIVASGTSSNILAGFLRIRDKQVKYSKVIDYSSVVNLRTEPDRYPVPLLDQCDAFG